MTDAASAPGAKRGTTARSRSRQRAVEILFEAEQRGSTVLQGIETRRSQTDLQVNAYTQLLVEGVIADQERLDEALTSYSRGWSLDRMPAVDRAILRVGAWELLSRTTCRTPSPCPRPWPWPRSSPRTTPRSSSTASSAVSSR